MGRVRNLVLVVLATLALCAPLIYIFGNQFFEAPWFVDPDTATYLTGDKANGELDKNLNALASCLEICKTPLRSASKTTFRAGIMPS